MSQREETKRKQWWRENVIDCYEDNCFSQEMDEKEEILNT